MAELMEPFIWVWRIILVTIIIVFIIFTIFSYMNEKIEIFDIENAILIRTLAYSPECLAYTDETGPHPGFIDIKKFTDGTLKKCLSKLDTGYIVELYDINNHQIKTAKNIDLKKETYIPVCETIPEFRCAEKTQLVSYSTQKGFNTGYLKVKVIQHVKA